MACCKCCCGNKDCAEGQAGKCCCGGTEKTCCKAGEYCCDGTCKSTPCSGACCDPVFGCSQPADEETCTSLGGDWLGYGIPCDPNPCPGACCDTLFGNCDQETQADCEDSGRTFLGVGVPCSPNPCDCDENANNCDCSIDTGWTEAGSDGFGGRYCCDPGYTFNPSSGFCESPTGLTKSRKPKTVMFVCCPDGSCVPVTDTCPQGGPP